MKNAKWWTIDTIFVVGVGLIMAGAFGTSFFAPQGSRTGSALVPAATLERLITNGGLCQTITDEEVLQHTPRKRC